MYLPKTPNIAKNVFPKLLWSKKSAQKEIYLTFDDGPTPHITEWVLQELKRFNAKATFFCLGKNVVLYPDIFEQIQQDGHSVGNHTYHHLNAWKTPINQYLQDIESCEKVFHSELFRPPYGKLKPGIRRKILENYNIVMWDVLSYDFDEKITNDECFENVKKHTNSGSIIVFHDSVKAEERLKFALSNTLKYFTNEGYVFKHL